MTKAPHDMTNDEISTETKALYESIVNLMRTTTAAVLLTMNIACQRRVPELARACAEILDGPVDVPVKLGTGFNIGFVDSLVSEAAKRGIPLGNHLN